MCCGRIQFEIDNSNQSQKLLKEVFHVNLTPKSIYNVIDISISLCFDGAEIHSNFKYSHYN